MRCNYPLCRSDALFTPVVEVPCIRTIGVYAPSLSPLVNNHDILRKMGLARRRIIQQYERSLLDYKATVSNMAYSDRPTYLICREVCRVHKETYNLFNWIRRSDWRVLREAARHHGYELPEHDLVTVKFHEIGWRPSKGSMLMTRGESNGTV